MKIRAEKKHDSITQELKETFFRFFYDIHGLLIIRRKLWLSLLKCLI